MIAAFLLNNLPLGLAIPLGSVAVALLAIGVLWAIRREWL